MVSDDVVISLIGAAALLLSVILSNRNTSAKIKRVAKDVAETKEQVSNNHVDPDGKPINLREEADERHKENAAAIAALSVKYDTIIEIVEAISGSLRRLWKHADSTDDRIEEMTQPRSTFAPPPKHRKETPA